ncbi:MAG: hypothetical protein PHP50_14775 [Lachnospiraceae bacterium]|nr:hypothetical protein [Lachnospiraceae bacterium]
MDNVLGMYDDLIDVMGDLEADTMIMESLLLNGKNEKANRYLKCALEEMRRALSYMSDAEFEITTTPENY